MEFKRQKKGVVSEDDYKTFIRTIANFIDNPEAPEHPDNMGIDFLIGNNQHAEAGKIIFANIEEKRFFRKPAVNTDFINRLKDLGLVPESVNDKTSFKEYCKRKKQEIDQTTTKQVVISNETNLDGNSSVSLSLTSTTRQSEKTGAPSTSPRNTTTLQLIDKSAEDAKAQVEEIINKVAGGDNNKKKKINILMDALAEYGQQKISKYKLSDASIDSTRFGIVREEVGFRDLLDKKCKESFPNLDFSTSTSAGTKEFAKLSKEMQDCKIDNKSEKLNGSSRMALALKVSQTQHSTQL